MIVKIVGVFLIFTFIGINLSSAGITVEQMKKTGKMMRDVCQPKYKLSDGPIDAINDGVFPDDKDLKCYVNCVMEMMQSMKKGKVNYESSLKQIDLLMPDEMKEPTKVGLEKCKDAWKGIKDNCEASYVVLQCFYKHNTAFMFP